MEFKHNTTHVCNFETKFDRESSKVCWSNKTPYTPNNDHNITQRYGPLEYNNRMMGVQPKYESPCATFKTPHYYIPKAHRTRVQC